MLPDTGRTVTRDTPCPASPLRSGSGICLLVVRRVGGSCVVRGWEGWGSAGRVRKHPVPPAVHFRCYRKEPDSHAPTPPPHAVSRHSDGWSGLTSSAALRGGDSLGHPRVFLFHGQSPRPERISRPGSYTSSAGVLPLRQPGGEVHAESAVMAWLSPPSHSLNAYPPWRRIGFPCPAPQGFRFISGLNAGVSTEGVR